MRKLIVCVSLRIQYVERWNEIDGKAKVVK